MKKILLFALLFASLLSYANDIIITIDNNKIEVNITAVTKETITYKLTDKTDSTDYEISTSEISYIVFDNGQTKTYRQTNIEKKQAEEKTTQNRISFEGHTFFLNGEKMDKGEYPNLLKYNCKEAYNVYKKGNAIQSAGIAILCLGGIMDIAGGLWYLTTGNKKTYLYLGVPATILEISSIPCIVVGYKKIQNSAYVYNSNCSKQTAQLSLGLTAGPNGLGLALSF